MRKAAPRDSPSTDAITPSGSRLMLPPSQSSTPRAAGDATSCSPAPAAPPPPGPSSPSARGTSGGRWPAPTCSCKPGLRPPSAAVSSYRASNCGCTDSWSAGQATRTSVPPRNESCAPDHGAGPAAAPFASAAPAPAAPATPAAPSGCMPLDRMRLVSRGVRKTRAGFHSCALPPLGAPAKASAPSAASTMPAVAGRERVPVEPRPTDPSSGWSLPKVPCSPSATGRGRGTPAGKIMLSTVAPAPPSGPRPLARVVAAALMVRTGEAEVACAPGRWAGGESGRWSTPGWSQELIVGILREKNRGDQTGCVACCMPPSACKGSSCHMVHKVRLLPAGSEMPHLA